MKKGLLIIVLLLTAFYSFSQKKIPVGKHKTNTWHNSNEDYLEGYRDSKHLRVNIFYPYLNLLNKNFSSKVSNDNLKRKIGFGFGLEFYHKYFKAGINYANNKFDVVDEKTKFQDIKPVISLNSLDGKVDFVLTPQVKRLLFYIGAGYNYQLIKYEVESTSVGEVKYVGEVFGNIGFNIFLSRKTIFFAEYQQSINFKGENAFNNIKGGIAFTIF